MQADSPKVRNVLVLNLGSASPHPHMTVVLRPHHPAPVLHRVSLTESKQVVSN
jgi:hypothetical protein